MSGLLNVATALGSLGFAGNSAPVTIGSMTLTGTEVPTLLEVEGEQTLVVTTFPGGGRTIQAMGDNPAKLTLAGMFIGPGAQQRAEQMLAMRKAGAQIQFTVSRIAATVVIGFFAYTLQDKGAVAPYRLVLEVLPTTAAIAGSTTSSLSALVGSDIASAINSVASTIGDVSEFATTAINQAQTISQQITPVASLIGLGGPLAAAGNYLSSASLIAQTGSNFASTPSAAATLITGLGNAGTSLMSTISSASTSLSSIGTAAPTGELVSEAASLTNATGQAGVLSGAVQAGALVNRAAANAVLATSGASLPVPVVHA